MSKPMKHAIINRLAAAALILGSSLLHAQNLVPNGGFENGFTGWHNGTNTGGVATHSLETEQPYAGAQALKRVITNSGSNPHSVQTLGPTFDDLGTDRATTITFRARAATPGTQVRFAMQTSVFRSQTFTLSTSWEYYVWHHTTAENSPQLRIHYLDAGTVWLDEISVVAHDDPPSGNVLLNIDPTVRHQVMDGFGGALTWTSRRVLTSPHRDTLEHLIFDDLGLDIIRLKNWYFPSNWPTNPDPETISPGFYLDNHSANNSFYEMAKKDGRDIRILFSSWSPPAILKTNNNLQNGGTLNKVNGKYVYEDLAQYWVDLLDNMTWTPDYLSWQNEPDWVAAHETCEFAPTETATLAGYAEAFDAIHNRLKDRPDLPILVGPESESMNKYLTQAVPLRTRDYIGVNAFHNYNMTDTTRIDTQNALLNSIRAESVLTNRPNWMTEFSRGSFDWMHTARVIHNTLVEADSSAYIYWTLVWGVDASPPQPHPEYMISVNTAGEYAIGLNYYTMKHFSKHISRGYQRIGVTGGNDKLRASAYINPAGNKVTLIVINADESGNETDVSLRFSGLPVGSATAIRTRQFNIGNPYNSLGAVNLANTQRFTRRTIQTYVIDLEETLNPYDPSQLFVEDIRHHGDRVSVAIPAQPGHNFILWKSTTLEDGSWHEVADAILTESDGQLILTDPNPDPVRAFYSIQRDTGL